MPIASNIALIANTQKAFNLAEASPFSESGIMTPPCKEGFHISKNGDYLFYIDNNPESDLNRYPFGISFLASSLSTTLDQENLTDFSGGTGLSMLPDGSKVYYTFPQLGYGSEIVKYNLTSNFDIRESSTASKVTKTVIDEIVRDLHYVNNTTMYGCGNDSKVYKFTYTSNNLDDFALDQTVDLSLLPGSPVITTLTGIYVTADQRKLYTVDTSVRICEFIMPNADFSLIEYTGNVITPGVTISGCSWSPDGRNLYFYDQTNDKIIQYRT